MIGQASGGWTESSSSLRILHAGVRNSVACVLTEDGFTQTNPPVVTTPTSTYSSNVNTRKFGVLSGSVAIARPDQGSMYVGGPGSSTLIAASGGGTASTGSAASSPQGFAPVGLFLNDAAGNPYENLPAVASGMAPYTSSQGTYGTRLFETQALVTVGALAQGAAITYRQGTAIVASLNGYIMPARVWTGAAEANYDLVTTALQSAVINAASSSTAIGIIKMVPDSSQNEVVFDQRI